MSKQYFGTDGIRGRVGQTPITPEFCLRLGWAVGRVFLRRARGDRCHILIGKDTRISGYMLESVLESGLASAHRRRKRSNHLLGETQAYDGSRHAVEREP